MSYSGVFGLQWGDEGKGKIVDILSAHHDIACRFQGGNNAGHTVIIGDRTYKLSLLPSSILTQGKIAYIGPGVVIDISHLVSEIQSVRSVGVDISEHNLKIAANAPVILDVYKFLDGESENAPTGIKIGTTKRGIGFAYADHTARRGIRLCDIPDTQSLQKHLESIQLFYKSALHNKYEFNIAAQIENLQILYNQIKSYLVNPYDFYNTCKGQKIIFEGAQGVMLDNTFGTYPFVTSSNTITGAIFTGSGFGYHNMNRIIGVTKAYATRVGMGPFPTEDFGTIGDMLQGKGAEFGTVTKRKRRCGFLDLVALKHAIHLCGITEIALTKIDVLDGMKEIPVCVKYENHTSFPLSQSDQETIKPIYETLDGWSESVTSASTFNELPANAKKYIEYIESNINVPIKIISIGPERNATIFR